MSIIKFNYCEELKRVSICEDAPCSICRGRLAVLAAADLLTILKAAERRNKKIRRARRVGNLIMFPKL